MDQVIVVRHKVLQEKKSRRAVALELGMSRRTVKRYVEGAPVGERKASTRASPVSDAVKERVHALLEESLRWTRGKQRLTTRRLLRLLSEEGVSVGLTVVKSLMREWKRQRAEVFVPLVYKPGDLAEVDFFEVYVDVAGERKKAWMFLMRLMHSGRDFAWLYPRQDQVCFLDGHVRAFAHFGGTPHRIVYDNLKAAVAKVLAGSERVLSARFAALVAHHSFEPCFARPRTGHDKGGVEARGKGIRLQELVPIPVGDDLTSISAALLARLAVQASSGVVAERFVDEQAALLHLPAHAFEPALPASPTVTRSAMVKLAGAHYSVWSTWNRLEVRAYVGVDKVVIVGPDHQRVEHPRQPFGSRSVDYRHFLPELAKKPQALRQVADELLRDLGPPYDVLWRQLVDTRGPKDAARELAKVLAVIVDRGDTAVRPLVAAAIDRKEPVLLALRPVAATPSMTAVPASLAGIEVGGSDVAEYDRLLVGGVA